MLFTPELVTRYADFDSEVEIPNVPSRKSSRDPHSELLDGVFCSTGLPRRNFSPGIETQVEVMHLEFMRTVIYNPFGKGSADQAQQRGCYLMEYSGKWLCTSLYCTSCPNCGATEDASYSLNVQLLALSFRREPSCCAVPFHARCREDFLVMIPFVIILIIPLSPVGHVLVFGERRSERQPTNSQTIVCWV